MSKLNMIKAIAEGAVAGAVALTGTAIAYIENQEERNNNYCSVQQVDQQDICPKILAAVDWACSIANNDRIGYSFGNARDGEYDCSGLVISAYRNAGIDVGNATCTGNMLKELTAHGFVAFEYHDNVDELMVGDILLLEGHHTEMYIGGGNNVGAHKDFDGVYGDSSGEEIDYGPFNEYTHNWGCVLRYEPKWYDWYNAPEIPDNFYAFVECSGLVMSSSGGTLHLEFETGDAPQVWHFSRYSTGRYTISTSEFHESYNLYQDNTGSTIFKISGSDTCLTAADDATIHASDYDSCSSAQRFTIRPVSDPIRVMYDYGGPTCDYVEEHYGEAYKGASAYHVGEGFNGWYTEREGGVKVDTSKVTNPYNHDLYAHFDAVPEESKAMHHGGGGRHDEQPAEEETEISVPAEVYSEPNIVQTEPVANIEITNQVQERTPVIVDSVSLNRYSKTLNTVGNSTSFTLTAEAHPSNADDRRIRFESSNSNIARVDSSTGYITAVSDGSCQITAYASSGVSASCEVIVSTQYTTRSETIPVINYESVPESYNMECFVGRTVAGRKRQYFNYDISNMLSSLGLSEAYGMWHHEYTFPANEVDAAQRIYRGQQQGGSQNGTNACDAVGYSMMFPDAPYIFFIKSTNYRTVETTTYQTQSTLVPVEYD